ncbi:MaoC family dehydratase N-terminal domain-containing protein [Pseudooceanicola sp.]|uniref:FAS1-like dehydratase domain-containing protein n=1 Tax=Pseudooceanicola sp. TaxID=1914328 RepID=UPI0026306C3B|nr:MaoC family dehydratase N-terminal domain-containing protein [Pseudooceanicola sp.]MDF1856474.1 MaoC family dehydratase N-terminal domain-containing protein [Pseudooceanicola sp.]
MTRWRPGWDAPKPRKMFCAGVDFCPPVPLPARMWADGGVTHIARLKIGKTVTRRSLFGDITAKQGRSGAIVFVTVEHEYFSGNRLCIREKKSIVFREITKSRPVMLPCELLLHNEGTETFGTVWCQNQNGVRSFSAENATV